MSSSVDNEVISDLEALKPVAYSKRKITFKGKLLIKSTIEFRDCDLIFHKADIKIFRAAKIKFENCSLFFDAASISGYDTIGDDVVIINSKINFTKCVFNDLTRIIIRNTINNSIEFTKCLFNNFKQLLSIESTVDEYVLVDRCVFNNFISNALYLKSHKSLVQDVNFNNCHIGISAILLNKKSELTISEGTFNNIGDVGIEVWMYSPGNRLIVNDIICLNTKIGMKIKYTKKGDNLIKEGELLAEENIIIDTFDGGNNRASIYIDEMTNENQIKDNKV